MLNVLLYLWQTRYKSLFRFTFSPCAYAHYYRNFAQIPKNDITKSHIVSDKHEFLNLYGKELPKFKKVSKIAPAP